MASFAEWRKLASETFRALEPKAISGLYSLEWAEAQKRLVSEHADAIEKERSRPRRFVRTTSAILYGVAKRLSPARRFLFALALVFAIFSFAGAFVPEGPSSRIGAPLLHMTLAFLLATALLGLELVDKLGFRDELELARDLQASLLPSSPPEFAGFDVGAYNRIANTVGGDLYDFAHLPDGRLAILFGDASGHGMAAGLLMAVAEASFRTQLEADPASPAIVGTLNRMLFRAGGKRTFFAAAYVLLRSDGAFEATLAGHPPLSKLGPDGRVVARIGAGSYPLGIRPDMSWEQVEGRIEPGETLLFYSDGLVEARDEAGNELGEERVESIARTLAGRPAAQLVAALAADVEIFTGRRAPEDDVSIVAFRRSRVPPDMPSA